MKKVRTRVGHIAIATMLASAFLFPVLGGAADTVAPIRASAETEKIALHTRLDDNFEIKQGAALNKGSGDSFGCDHEDALTKLKYTLSLKNPELYDFCENPNDFVLMQWTVYKDMGPITSSDDGEIREVRDAEAKFSVRCLWDGTSINWMHKVVEYDEDLPFNGLLDFIPNQKNAPDDAVVIDYDGIDYKTSDGYTMDLTVVSKDVCGLVWDDESTPEVAFFITLGSPYSSYFVDFEYSFHRYVKTIDHWFSKDEIVYSRTAGHLTSDVRSIYWILSAIESGGTEWELACRYTDGCTEVLDKAQEILRGEPKPVRVEYLKRIKGTPFAEKVQAVITVPAAQNTIYKDDVESALGRDAMTALNSVIKNFVWNEERQLYEAVYHSNIWIDARDMEGHAYNYFLDCSKSYRDYYNELKSDCGFSDGMYDYMFGQMLRKYDALLTYSDSQVYGYFGYTVIPDQPLFGSFDSMWEEAFGSNKRTTGGIRMYSYVEKLSASAYDVLLAQYGHSWLNRTWNQIITAGGQLEEFEATHYFFWAEDISMDKVVISENGTVASGDTNGIMQNEITEIVKDVAVEVGVKLENSGNNGLKDIGDTVVDVIKGILTTTLIVAASLLGISVLVKIIKPKLKSLKPKKKKAGKKKDPKKNDPKKEKTEPKQQQPKDK
ncbi:MAG: hypothetical protein IJF39_03855 [Clostridia bacterium]|nr:hypothetical protein [Clostridia bacterium]